MGYELRRQDCPSHTVLKLAVPQTAISRVLSSHVLGPLPQKALEAS